MSHFLIAVTIVALGLAPLSAEGRNNRKPSSEVESMLERVAEANTSKPGTKPSTKPKARKPADETEGRLEKLEAAVERIEGELEIIKEQSRLVIRRTTVGYLNAWYMKAGFSILLPRQSGFTSKTDTGLGAHIGLGRYLGRNHVFDLAFDWDVYPALSLRYRLEMHSNNPTISLGPVVGVKQKLFSSKPWDRFINDPKETNSTFAILGLYGGIPLSRSVISGELDVLLSKQIIFTFSAMVHFFF